MTQNQLLINKWANGNMDLGYFRDNKIMTSFFQAISAHTQSDIHRYWRVSQQSVVLLFDRSAHETVTPEIWEKQAWYELPLYEHPLWCSGSKFIRLWSLMVWFRYLIPYSSICSYYTRSRENYLNTHEEVDYFILDVNKISSRNI